MKSLRSRLFMLLAAATLTVWSAAAVWTYFSTRADVQRVLDRRLVEAAGMVASLVENSSDLIARTNPAQLGRVRQPGYSRQLSCQIWTLDWRLVGRSASAPTTPLAAAETGFSQRTIQGEQWRVYTLVERRSGLRILVGDNLSVRRNLIGDVLTGLLLPALIGLLALAILIWSAIDRALVPIRRVAAELVSRDAGNTAPLSAVEADVELRPLVDSINHLFGRLHVLRMNERQFIANAAHELQTPLAGLKAHAQIALAATDANTREQSLRSIQASVDRTSRLVQQLLDLSREEAEDEPATERWSRLDLAVAAVADELSPLFRRKRLTLNVSRDASNAEVGMDEAAVILCLRNLLRNAAEHAPEGTEVSIALNEVAKGQEIVIADEGPGIPESELKQIRGRFVRGSRTKGAGSGLGLSIVELVLKRASASLELTNRSPSGIEAVMLFPRASIRIDERLQRIEGGLRTD